MIKNPNPINKLYFTGDCFDIFLGIIYAVKNNDDIIAKIYPIYYLLIKIEI